MNEKELLEKFGWYVHFVIDDDDYPYNVNYHTHGLADSWDHLDLQIVLNVGPEMAYGIFKTVIDLVKAGHKFADGEISKEVLQNEYGVKFFSTIEMGRPVLRLIIPDEDGNTDDGSFTDSKYARQYD